MYYLRARYYDPSISRFISEDPAEDGVNWYAYCGNNPVAFVDPIGLEPIALRQNVEYAGGSVDWNEDSRTATVIVNGYIEEFYEGDDYGTYIDNNGVMYVDDLHLNNIIYAPTGMARNFYDAISDDFGKFILRTWLNGDGSTQILSDQRWVDFIKENSYVKDVILNAADNARANGNTFFIFNPKYLSLSGGSGGYDSGVNLINGANSDLGGFSGYGNINEYGVDVHFTFADIIDPNDSYILDTIFAAGAKTFGYSCRDYNIFITGNFSY